MKLFMNRKTIIVMSLLLMLPAMGAVAQRVLGLDSLRRLALQNNKQLLSGQAQMEAADYTQRAAKTAYLPKVSADAAYIHNSRSTHLLSKDTRETLGSAGETAGSKLQALAQQIAQQSPEMAQLLGSLGTPLVQAIGSAGQGVVDAFRTSTYNVYAGSLLLTQPLYMGGRIKALDRMAGYTRQLLGAQYDQTTQDVIYSVDQAYWQVVSLAQKRRLAESYVKLLQKLDDDVQKMLREGVATKATSLTVGVKLNEAEMTLTKVEDGLSLSRMLLCQICGLDLTEPVTLADEGAEHVETALSEVQADTAQAFSKRKEKWYARTLVARSDSLPISAWKDEALTKAADLGLTDGEYEVEVALAGGSGRASVQSPAKIKIEGGTATATIIWGSSNYDYMIVDGTRYDPITLEGGSTFEIPVTVFDRPMQVTADTTAMSKPYEIEYTLTFDSKTIK